MNYFDEPALTQEQAELTIKIILERRRLRNKMHELKKVIQQHQDEYYTLVQDAQRLISTPKEYFNNKENSYLQSCGRGGRISTPSDNQTPSQTHDNFMKRFLKIN